MKTPFIFAEKNLNSGYFCYTFRRTDKLSQKTLNTIDSWASVGVVKKDYVTEAVEFANGVMSKIIPGRKPVFFCQKFSGKFLRRLGVGVTLIFPVCMHVSGGFGVQIPKKSWL